MSILPLRSTSTRAQIAKSEIKHQMEDTQRNDCTRGGGGGANCRFVDIQDARVRLNASAFGPSSRGGSDGAPRRSPEPPLLGGRKRRRIGASVFGRRRPTSSRARQ